MNIIHGIKAVGILILGITTIISIVGIKIAAEENDIKATLMLSGLFLVCLLIIVFLIGSLT